MAEVPLTNDELEQVVSVVAGDLLEDFIIKNDIVEEDLPQWVNLSAEITIFVINEYMKRINEIMDKRALAATEWNLQNPL